jgi:hypothetical protein
VLIDMDGGVRHEWAFAFAEAFPNSDAPADLNALHFWRRAHPFPNGHLLAIFNG